MDEERRTGGVGVGVDCRVTVSAQTTTHVRRERYVECDVDTYVESSCSAYLQAPQDLQVALGHQVICHQAK